MLWAFCKGFCQLLQKGFTKTHMVRAKPHHRALATQMLWGRCGGAGLCSTFRGHWGLPQVQAAGCRHLSSQHGIYWPVTGNHDPLMVAGWGGPAVKSTVMDASRHPALLLHPCQAPAKCHGGGTLGKGLCSTHGWGRGTGKLALSSSALSQRWKQGVTFSQAELDTFTACVGLVFSHSLFFFPLPQWRLAHL